MTGAADLHTAPSNGREIAVVGMAGRFPGARDLAAFWRNLRAGEEAIAPLSDEELRRAGVPEAAIADPDYVKAASRIDDPDRFDAPFFGYTAAEAEIMDPQQRLFLEHVWEAMEDAGHGPGTYAGLVGVYAGVAWNTYLLSNLREHPELFEGGGGFQVFITNDKDFMPTRASYKLDLKGPSVVVQTSCSTSLVAVHLACLSLLSYECDMAVVGGVTVKVPQDAGYLHQEGGLASPDGHCRAFDARAAGTVFGSGVGVVVLKRLDDARADGDRIRAVVKGSAINNDGATKASYTAPGVEGQAEVIAAAQAVAEVEARSIGYVEAHGTGTALGDPIEVSALTRVFRQSTDDTGFCALGSVKTNIGHLDAAAGIAGFLKTVLALEHREIPPSLHFEEPNPAIDFASSPFYVAAERADWPVGELPRRAGVSSFGVGGTNAHVVLEEAPPEPPPAAPAQPRHLLVLSARTGDALDRATERLRSRLEEDPTLNGPVLADAAFTLAAGRTVFRHRRALVCRDRADALEALSGRAPGRLATAVDTDDPRDRPVAFLFPGQGSQHPAMAHEWYRHDPVFRREMDRAAAALEGEARDLLRALADGDGVAPERLEETRFAQVALFAVEHALARSWMAWGVRPQAMLGHSIGEYVAASLAGVFPLEEGIALVAERGRLMQSCPPGAMLAVPLSEADLAPLLPGGVSLAAVNEPDRSVASGPEEGIAALARELAARGVEGRQLHTSHAFHSASMDPIAEPFREVLARVALRPPEIPYLSNVTGTWITPAQATDPGYWLDHLRQPVRFADGVAELLGQPDGVFLEVGPGRTLTTLVRRHPGAARGETRRPVIPSLPHPRDRAREVEDGDDLPSISHRLRAAGRLWLAGVPIDWRALHGEGRRRLPLPTYPFERRRYWIDGAAGERRSGARPAPAAAPVEKRPEPVDWLYLPTWRPEPPAIGAAPGDRAGGVALLFAPAGAGRALTDRLAGLLAARGRRVVTVEPASGAGEPFRALGADRYALSPAEEEPYDELLAAIGGAPGSAPFDVIHAWSLAPEAAPAAGPEELESALATGASSLLALGRALARRFEGAEEGSVRLLVVADRLESVTPAEDLVPERAALLGLVRVVPQEHPEIAARAVDLRLPPGSGRAADGALRHLAGAVLGELEAAAGPSRVAWRGRQRWVQSFERLPTGEPGEADRPLRRRGVYLLTGGLAGDGLAVARWLAREHEARLALLEPAGEPDDPAAEREALRTLGDAAWVVRAELADPRDVRRAVEEAEHRLGAIDGLVHAAGTRGERTFRTLRETDRAELLRHLATRVHPLYALERALEGRDLGFAVVLSSLATVLGGLAYGPYAATGLVLDAFARDRSRRGGLPWRRVDWDVWLADDGSGGITTVRPDLAELAMSREEGEEAFARALAADGVEQVLVSTADLPARIAEAEGRLRDRAPARAGELHPRPDLEIAYAAPSTETERSIAAVWGRALGFREVGVDDNFFDLGGDSFLAVQVAARLRQELEVDLPVAQLYQGLTVRALAASLAEGGGEAAARRAARLEERRVGRDRRRAAAARRREREVTQ